MAAARRGDSWGLRAGKPAPARGADGGQGDLEAQLGALDGAVRVLDAGGGPALPRDGERVAGVVRRLVDLEGVELAVCRRRVEHRRPLDLLLGELPDGRRAYEGTRLNRNADSLRDFDDRPDVILVGPCRAVRGNLQLLIDDLAGQTLDRFLYMRPCAGKTDIGRIDTDIGHEVKDLHLLLECRIGHRWRLKPVAECLVIELDLPFGVTPRGFAGGVPVVDQRMHWREDGSARVAEIAYRHGGDVVALRGPLRERPYVGEQRLEHLLRLSRRILLDDTDDARLAVLVAGGIGIYTGAVPITATQLADAAGYFLLGLTVAFFGWLFLSPGWTPRERKRLYVIGVLFLGAALFWSQFEQAGSTLNLFADRNSRNSLFGWAFPSTWYQSLNSLFIIELAPLFAWFWVWLGRRGAEPSSPAKFGWGLVLVANRRLRRRTLFRGCAALAHAGTQQALDGHRKLVQLFLLEPEKCGAPLRGGPQAEVALSGWPNRLRFQQGAHPEIIPRVAAVISCHWLLPLRVCGTVLPVSGA